MTNPVGFTNNYNFPDLTAFTAERGKIIPDVDIAALPASEATSFSTPEAAFFEDVAGAVSGLFAYFTYSEYDLADREKDNQRQQIGQLAQQQGTMISRRDALSKTIATLERNEKPDLAALKAKQVEFLQLQIDLLKNLEQQDKLIRAYDPKAAFVSPKFSELIAVVTEELRQLKSQDPSMLGRMQALISQQFERILRGMLEQSKNIPALRQKQTEFQTLLSEIKDKGLDDARLQHLNTCVRELHELTAAFEENEGLRKLITDRLTSLITQHPMLTKMLLLTAATAIGNTLAGSAGAIACRAVVTNLMSQFPTDEPGTRTERIVSAIFQAATLHVAGNNTAAAVALGHGVFNEVAPKEAQQAVEAGAFAMVAGRLGVPVSVGIGAGIGAVLLSRNTQVVKKIRQDLFAAKQTMRNTPFRAPLKFSKWSVLETWSFGKNVVGAARKGKKREVATRLAVISFSALAISSTIWTVPLSFSLIYLSNRVFELKYEGPAWLGNDHFRRYVLNELKSTSAEDRVNKLKAVLLEENEAFKDFVEKLDRLIAKPVELPPQAEDLEPIVANNDYLDYSAGCGMA